MLTEQDVLNEIRRHPGLNKLTLARRLGLKKTSLYNRLDKLKDQIIFIDGRGEMLVYDKAYAAANGIEQDPVEEAGMITRDFDRRMKITSASK